MYSLKLETAHPEAKSAHTTEKKHLLGLHNKAHDIYVVPSVSFIRHGDDTKEDMRKKKTGTNKKTSENGNGSQKHTHTQRIRAKYFLCEGNSYSNAKNFPLGK